jgi:DNA-binding FadR family transcriptional regulator
MKTSNRTGLDSATASLQDNRDDLIQILPPDNDGGAVSSAVRLAASRLRQMVLALDGENQFIGSEEDLIRQLDISRPTFRQVARLLEHEQLLKIKRGPGGGFFTRRPSVDAVAHLASICLVARKARLADMVQAGSPLVVEAARLAAASSDLDRRAQLLQFCQQSTVEDGASRRSSFVRISDEFSALLFALSGNPVLEMFIQIVREFAAEVHAEHGLKTEFMQSYLTVMHKLAHAVNEGDVEVAGIMAARLNTETARWMA